MEADKGTAVILLVDDEPLVRNVVQIALTRSGYQVLVATDGAEALELAAAYDGHIDLVVSDVKMPNVTGPELIERLEQERPGVRVILMTGKSSGKIPPRLRPGVLRKPFPPAELVRRVREELDELRADN